MKSHRITTRRPHRKRRPADEERQPPSTHEADRPPTPAESLDALRQPATGHAARGAAALGLQRTVGNAQVARELGALQRYAVAVAPDASCERVVGWLNTRNPYVPNWALTRASFTWSGDFAISGSAPNYHLTISSPQVTMSGPSVDMPEWSPSGSAMQAAWSDMYARLRRHEGEHEKIANKWNTLLTERLTNLDIAVNASSRAAVNRRANALVNAEWNRWLREYRREMTSIDPHTEDLNCPTAEADSAGGDGDDGTDSVES